MKLLSSVSSLVLVRLALFSHMIVSFGLGSDFAWHMRYWGEDMFKVSHLVMWSGMAMFVLIMLVLKLRKHPIPWHLFFIFPIWLFLYIATDEFFDEYFAFNSGTFWTPFRLTWGPMVLYHLYRLYTLGIETNSYLLTYMRTMIFFLLPLRFIYFIFTPFAVFSVHPELHGVFSPLVALIIPFAALFMYKAQEHSDILIPGIVLLSSLREPYSQYFFHIDNFYKGPQASFVVFGLLFLIIAVQWYSRISYTLLATVTVSLLFFVHYMWTGGINMFTLMLCIGGAMLAAHAYFECEHYLLEKIRPMIRRIS